MIDIDKLLELESRATKDPWEVKTLTSHNVLSGDYALTYKHLYIQGQPVNVFDEKDLEFICMARNNIRPLLLELKAARKVIEAARHHLNYAKEKENCGPCFDYCPNAIDGEADCECGGSMIWYSLKQLEGGEK